MPAHSRGNMLSIELKLPNKRIIDINLPEKSKTTDIYAIAEEATGLSFPSKDCSLFWKGSRLGHNMTLDYYRIPNRGKIELIRKMKTGYDDESTSKGSRQYTVTPTSGRRITKGETDLIPDTVHVPNTPAGALAEAEGRHGYFSGDYNYYDYGGGGAGGRSNFVDDRLETPAYHDTCSLSRRPTSGGRNYQHLGASDDLVPPTPAYYGSSALTPGAGGGGRLPELYQPTALNESLPDPFYSRLPPTQTLKTYTNWDTTLPPDSGRFASGELKTLSPNRSDRRQSYHEPEGLYHRQYTASTIPPPSVPYVSALGTAAYPETTTSRRPYGSGRVSGYSSTRPSSLNTSTAPLPSDPAMPTYFSDALARSRIIPPSQTYATTSTSTTMPATATIPQAVSQYAYAHDPIKQRDYERALEDQVRGTKQEYSKALDRISELESTVQRLQTLASRAVETSRGFETAGALSAARAPTNFIIGGPASYDAPIGGLPTAYTPYAY